MEIEDHRREVFRVLVAFLGGYQPQLEHIICTEQRKDQKGFHELRT